MFLWRVLEVVVFFALLQASSVWAATYWVSPSGSDANSCGAVSGESDPGTYRTLPGGLSCLSGGDKIKLKNGVYNANLHNALPSGPSNSQRTVMEGESLNAIIRPAAGTTRSVINIDQARSNFTYRNFTADAINLRPSGQTGVLQMSDGRTITNFTIEDMVLENPQGPGIVTGDQSSNGLIRRNIIRNSVGQCIGGDETHSAHGMYYRTSNSVIEYNEIYGFPSQGINVRAGSGNVSNVTIRYNLIYNIGQAATSNTTCAGPNGINLQEQGGIVHNNVIYNIGDGQSSNIAGIDSPNFARDYQIYNNTIGETSGRGIRLVGSTTGFTVKNNVIFGPNTAIVDQSSGTNTISNNLTTNPSFKDAANGDFSLKAESPAIDAGVKISEITRDFLGTHRPQGCCYDIGAFEYVAPVTAPPLTPNNLQVIIQ